MQIELLIYNTQIAKSVFSRKQVIKVQDSIAKSIITSKMWPHHWTSPIPTSLSYWFTVDLKFMIVRNKLAYIIQCSIIYFRPIGVFISLHYQRQYYDSHRKGPLQTISSHLKCSILLTKIINDAILNSCHSWLQQEIHFFPWFVVTFHHIGTLEVMGLADNKTMLEHATEDVS